MAKKKPPTSVFVPEQFGAELRKKRRESGFASTKAFSDAIKDETGVYVDFDTLNKIERGEREPDVSKLVAMCATIGRKHNDHKGHDVLDDLLSFSEPIDYFYSEQGTYDTERLIVAEFRAKFGKDPTIEQIGNALDEWSLRCLEAHPEKDPVMGRIIERKGIRSFDKLHEQLTKDPDVENILSIIENISAD